MTDNRQNDSDVLHAPLIPITTPNGPQVLSLPALLAALVRGEVLAFEGLMAHQRQAWALFLYQVGGLALRDDPLTTPLPTEATVWREKLAALTPDTAETAWSLYVPDMSRPALFQPPMNKDSQAKLKPIGDTPDQIDVLVTAKNHDVKIARAQAPQWHHWLYALVSLQTSQGYSGRGNFGIARMNGGFASRMLVERVYSLSWQDRFTRGVQVAREQRHAILEKERKEGTLPLLWLEAWDREESLSLPRLDPLFIEICRRVRLTQTADGRVQALGRPSEAARVNAKDFLGVVGDPWMPVNRSKKDQPSAYTPSAAGFRYDKVADLLFNQKEIIPAAAMASRPEDKKRDMWMHFSALVRGQGKTEGLHERSILIPHNIVIRALDEDTEDDEIKMKVIADAMIKDASTATKCLKAALLCLVQGAPEKIKFDDERATHFCALLTTDIDEAFFTYLWPQCVLEEDRTQAQRDWFSFLHQTAKAIFVTAQGALSPPASRREQALAQAENLFTGMFYKEFPLLKDQTKTEVTA